MAPAGIFKKLGRVRFVKRKDARSYVGQFFRMGTAFLGEGFTPLECHLYEFYKKAKSTDGYISRKWIEKEFRPKLNPFLYVRIVKNKLVFFYFYNRRKLPVLKVFGLLHPLTGFTTRRERLRSISDLQRVLAGIKGRYLVAKPPCTLGGKGMMVMKPLKDGKLYDVQREEEISLEGFYTRMIDDITLRQPIQDSCTGYLLQEYLPPHPSMNPLKGKVLNTVRIATLRDVSGNVRTDFAMIRVAKPSAVIDNLHKGGVVAGIGVESGEVSSITYGYERDEGPWVERKDIDLGDSFKRRRIPQWEGMVEMVREFHEVTPGINSIGWDVALTKKGPVVVEGNDNWDMVIAQVIEGPYLTPSRRKILKGYGVKMPTR